MVSKDGSTYEFYEIDWEDIYKIVLDALNSLGFTWAEIKYGPDRNSNGSLRFPKVVAIRDYE